MTRPGIVAFGVLVALLSIQATPSAHRLDEYLQATRIALAPDHVALEIDLTPGAEAAHAIFFAINTNRDGRISAQEGAAYARQVLRDLALVVQGHRQELSLVSSEFPSFEDMRAGTGVIRLSARTARLPRASGLHAVFYRNDHRPAMSVYLVNALLPATPAMVITNQQRDPDQRSLRLGFDVLEAPASSSWLQARLPLGLMGAILALVMGWHLLRQG
jgi:hypothetical protein